MQPFRSSSTEIDLKPPLIEKANPEILVSLATVPCLGLFVCGRLVGHWISQIGLASEEVFRGERLPTINLPIKPPD